MPSQPPSSACDRVAPSDVTGTGTFHWSISVAGYLNCGNSRSSGGLLASFRGRPCPSTPGSSCLRLSQPLGLCTVPEQTGRLARAAAGGYGWSVPRLVCGTQCTLLGAGLIPPRPLGAVMLGSSAHEPAGSGRGGFGADIAAVGVPGGPGERQPREVGARPAAPDPGWAGGTEGRELAGSSAPEA